MILVTNKIDRLKSAVFSTKPTKPIENYFKKHVHTCAVTGQGVGDLEEAILEVIGVEPIPSGGRQWATNQVSIVFPSSLQSHHFKYWTTFEWVDSLIS